MQLLAGVAANSIDSSNHICWWRGNWICFWESANICPRACSWGSLVTGAAILAFSYHPPPSSSSSSSSSSFFSSFSFYSSFSLFLLLHLLLPHPQLLLSPTDLLLLTPCCPRPFATSLNSFVTFQYPKSSL